MKKDRLDNVGKIYENIPLLALRGLTVFPGMLLHFDVVRDKSVKSLEEAIRRDNMVFLVSQKDLRVDDPGEKDLFRVGTVSHIKQILRIPGSDTVRVLIEGKDRARMTNMRKHDNHLLCDAVAEARDARPNTKTDEALIRQARKVFEEYSTLIPKMTGDIFINIMSAGECGHLADYIMQNMPIGYVEKQTVLEAFDPRVRIRKVIKILNDEIAILKIEHKINEDVRGQIEKHQHDYYLREQIKAIQEELGEGEDAFFEAEEYKSKIYALDLRPEDEAKLLKEVGRLTKMPFMSQESAVIRSYLDACLALPWNKYTSERSDIALAAKILDEDHFGLSKVKEQIIEFLSVKKLSGKVQGQILCLVGPPGVGKTSIAKSIARAMGRKYARMSLGGVRDEADIRGHRKTYVGSMPGRIINAVTQAGAKNCLILMDEVDKLGNDFRGDPASALLEVLDSEQNSSFRDHYIELPFDISKIVFITTANTTETIPKPLLDRMEIIHIPGYTDEEKLQIARRHLLPKQLSKNGLTKKNFSLDDAAIRSMITLYTREAGVRQLERELARLLRKAAKAVASDEKGRIKVTAADLPVYFGPPKYKPEHLSDGKEAGIVNGLAWTSVGGELLQVETSVVDGSGKLELTGNLGDVMKESAKAALTYIRSRAKALGIDPDFYKNRDIHIHFPEGAVPKDGPSAGITVATAIISALSGRPVSPLYAMTGEISLRGRVLPIGGLKEKTMAAYRYGVKTVVLPLDNKPDVEEIDKTVKEALSFVYVGHVDEVIREIFNTDSFQPQAKPQSDVMLPVIGDIKNPYVPAIGQ